MDDLLYEAKSADLKLRNTFNEFLMLSNSQFIENVGCLGHTSFILTTLISASTRTMQTWQSLHKSLTSSPTVKHPRKRSSSPSSPK